MLKCVHCDYYPLSRGIVGMNCSVVEFFSEGRHFIDIKTLLLTPSVINDSIGISNYKILGLHRQSSISMSLFDHNEKSDIYKKNLKLYFYHKMYNSAWSNL